MPQIARSPAKNSSTLTLLNQNLCDHGIIKLLAERIGVESSGLARPCSDGSAFQMADKAQQEGSRPGVQRASTGKLIGAWHPAQDAKLLSVLTWRDRAEWLEPQTREIPVCSSR